MKPIKELSSVLIVIAMLVVTFTVMAYPLDGYEETGIRRVEGARLANEGLAVGGFQPPGAMLTTEQVDIRFLGKDVSLPSADAAFTKQIRDLLGDQADDLRVLFYTVDHRRDTVNQLAAYLPFFNEEFVGLTHLDDPDNTHLPFEQGLGMVARLVPNEDPDSSDYQVVHGLTLFLLNPRGELQAIFEPGNAGLGVRSYQPDKLAADYLAVRQYLARENSPAG